MLDNIRNVFAHQEFVFKTEARQMFYFYSDMIISSIFQSGFVCKGKYVGWCIGWNDVKNKGEETLTLS